MYYYIYPKEVHVKVKSEMWYIIIWEKTGRSRVKMRYFYWMLFKKEALRIWHDLTLIRLMKL